MSEDSAGAAGKCLLLLRDGGGWGVEDFVVWAGGYGGKYLG